MADALSSRSLPWSRVAVRVTAARLAAQFGGKVDCFSERFTSASCPLTRERRLPSHRQGVTRSPYRAAETVVIVILNRAHLGLSLGAERKVSPLAPRRCFSRRARVSPLSNRPITVIRVSRGRPALWWRSFGTFLPLMAEKYRKNSPLNCNLKITPSPLRRSRLARSISATT